ncbi:hypothetical protein Bca52824_083838 [Brassica carinata]|uniref:MADS-box domain-containing protein n=1 Tax=Brassica carinata TaxID=52824 RepID=A0A8X7PMH0_BRACI|nr:hypothetical protein Bca52824_083838 [Brassica carinata]
MQSEGDTWEGPVVRIKMGRGRVQLKRIENKINRQVTFSKRRAGLFKKAHEISVLCDAEVALVVFSHKGKLFEYSTDSCMEKILERYERYSYAERQLIAPESDVNTNWSMEYNRLKAKIELLERNQRTNLCTTPSMSSKERRRRYKNKTACFLNRSRRGKRFLWHNKSNGTSRTMAKICLAAAPQQHQIQHPYMLSHQPSPFLNMGGLYQEEDPMAMRRNDLDLSLEPVYNCNLGCFAA